MMTPKKDLLLAGPWDIRAPRTFLIAVMLAWIHDISCCVTLLSLHILPVRNVGDNTLLSWLKNYKKFVFARTEFCIESLTVLRNQVQDMLKFINDLIDSRATSLSCPIAERAWFLSLLMPSCNPQPYWVVGCYTVCRDLLIPHLPGQGHTGYDEGQQVWLCVSLSINL